MGLLTLTGGLLGCEELLFLPESSRTIVAMDAGGGTTCAVTEDAHVFCWGITQGADGSGIMKTPLEHPYPVHLRTITVGGRTCGLTDAGTIVCWGYGSGPPASPPGDLALASISAGEEHTCGVAVDGVAYCWGIGALGDGRSPGPGRPTPDDFTALPTPVVGGLAFRSVSAGAAHTCGVTLDDRAFCWGSSGYGEVGSEPVVGKYPAPVEVQGGLRFRVVAAGEGTTCGVTTENRAYCWGDNSWGVLGTGTSIEQSSVPLPVSGNLSFADVEVSARLACGITTAGELHCWGLWSVAEPRAVGVATSVPAHIPLPTTVSSVSIGDVHGRTHACALTTAGDVYCWGNNDLGQLGIGSTEGSSEPRLVRLP